MAHGLESTGMKRSKRFRFSDSLVPIQVCYCKIGEYLLNPINLLVPINMFNSLDTLVELTLTYGFKGCLGGIGY